MENGLRREFTRGSERLLQCIQYVLITSRERLTADTDHWLRVSSEITLITWDKQQEKSGFTSDRKTYSACGHPESISAA